ncbi:hypothetical protein [Arthrobacter sp. 35W]|uniref:hypothetical protein n=1 Tax=Arthrobacter sp. 35W TaxID=1132441 RepID=UPI00047BA68F|nr:hypothetical protein [Arthrobacter sp. 35W]
MAQLGKFEMYLIGEFLDDYRAGAMTRRTFTRRVAFIMGSMAAAGAVPEAKSPLSVREGATGLLTATVRFPSGGTDISGYLVRPVRLSFRSPI